MEDKDQPRQEEGETSQNGDDHNIGDIIDLNRRNVAKKKWWQF